MTDLFSTRVLQVLQEVVQASDVCEIILTYLLPCTLFQPKVTYLQGMRGVVSNLEACVPSTTGFLFLFQDASEVIWIRSTCPEVKPFCVSCGQQRVLGLIPQYFRDCFLMTSDGVSDAVIYVTLESSSEDRLAFHYLSWNSCSRKWTEHVIAHSFTVGHWRHWKHLRFWNYPDHEYTIVFTSETVFPYMLIHAGEVFFRFEPLPEWSDKEKRQTQEDGMVSIPGIISDGRLLIRMQTFVFDAMTLVRQPFVKRQGPLAGVPNLILEQLKKKNPHKSGTPDRLTRDNLVDWVSLARGPPTPIPTPTSIPTRKRKRYGPLTVLWLSSLESEVYEFSLPDVVCFNDDGSVNEHSYDLFLGGNQHWMLFEHEVIHFDQPKQERMILFTPRFNV